MSKIDKEKLRAAIPTENYYRDQLGEPQGNIAGKQKYFCPFHPDKKTPNLIADEKGVKCFACDEGGDRGHGFHSGNLGGGGCCHAAP